MRLPLLGMAVVAACAPGAGGPRVPRFAADPAGTRRPDLVWDVTVDRFADGDPWNNEAFDRADPGAFHGGDLAGLLARVDAMWREGAGDIWLGPVFELHDEPWAGLPAWPGLWVRDPTRLEPRFGTVEEAVAVGTEVRRRGMGFGLEVRWAALAEDAPACLERKDWCAAADEGGRPLRRLRLDRREVRAWLVDATARWAARLGATVVRVGDADEIPAATLAGMAEALRARAGVRVVADVPAADRRALAGERRRRGLDAVYDRPGRAAVLSAACAGDVLPLAGAIAAEAALDDPHADLLSFVDRPLEARLPVLCPDRTRAQQALALALALPGTPVVSAGTDFGLAEPTADLPWGAPRPFAPLLREMSAARQAWPSLAEGAPWLLRADPDRVVAWVRVADDEATLVALDVADRQATVVPPAELRDGVVVDTFIEVDRPEGPYRRHQLVSGGDGRLRPFFVAPHTLVVAHLVAPEPGAFAALRARLLRDVEVLVRIDGGLAGGPPDVLHPAAGPLPVAPSPGGGWVAGPARVRAGSAVRWSTPGGAGGLALVPLDGGAVAVGPPRTAEAP